MRTFALFAIASAAIVAAQTSTQNNSTAAALAAQIPACAIPCDDAAITSVGCGLTDYACHCAHGSQLAQIIPACLKSNATCSPSDLTLFASLPPKICAALNATITTVTGTAVSVGTILPTGGAGAGVNSTVTSTARASNTAVGGSTVTSTNVQSATGVQTATNVPTGPSTTSSLPTPSAKNAAPANSVATGLLALVGAGLMGVLC